jgi:hypothetical protein
MTTPAKRATARTLTPFSTAALAQRHRLHGVGTIHLKLRQAGKRVSA